MDYALSLILTSFIVAATLFAIWRLSGSRLLLSPPVFFVGLFVLYHVPLAIDVSCESLGFLLLVDAALVCFVFGAALTMLGLGWGLQKPHLFILRSNHDVLNVALLAVVALHAGRIVRSSVINCLPPIAVVLLIHLAVKGSIRLLDGHKLSLHASRSVQRHGSRA